jgi:hypothetical protein
MQNDRVPRISKRKRHSSGPAGAIYNSIGTTVSEKKLRGSLRTRCRIHSAPASSCWREVKDDDIYSFCQEQPKPVGNVSSSRFYLNFRETVQEIATNATCCSKQTAETYSLCSPTQRTATTCRCSMAQRTTTSPSSSKQSETVKYLCSSIQKANSDPSRSKSDFRSFAHNNCNQNLCLTNLPVNSCPTQQEASDNLCDVSTTILELPSKSFCNPAPHDHHYDLQLPNQEQQSNKGRSYINKEVDSGPSSPVCEKKTSDLDCPTQKKAKSGLSCAVRNSANGVPRLTLLPSSPSHLIQGLKSPSGHNYLSIGLHIPKSASTAFTRAFTGRFIASYRQGDN